MPNMVGTYTTNVSPGLPYDPRIVTTALFKADKPKYGKSYYLRVIPNGASRTWLDDETVLKIMLRIKRCQP